jgi:hypothetical protein
MSLNDEGGREGVVLEWSVFPFKEKLWRSALVIAVIVAVGVVVGILTDLFMALLSVAILAASLFSFFTRTTYRLDDDGVVIKSSVGKTAKRWSHFKRYYADRKGITLSPFETRTRLEPFRSTRLLYGRQRDEVVAFVAKKLDGAAGSGNSG